MNQELTLLEIKNLEFDILKYVKQICEENNLRYYLAYGTLLGAIRHKGFIPWDDDIDIHMPRKDYEKFIAIVNNIKNTQYQVKSCEVTSDYYYEFAKIVNKRTVLKEINVKHVNDLGVWVDIFPLDGVPKNYKWHIKSLWMLIRIRVLSVKTILPKLSFFYNTLLFLLWIITKRQDSNKLAQYINKRASKFDFDKSEKVACSVSSAGVKGVFDKSIFSSSVKVDFENEEFDAPIGWRKYLEQCYGNYMKLPLKEKQISHHMYSINWK